MNEAASAGAGRAWHYWAWGALAFVAVGSVFFALFGERHRSDVSHMIRLGQIFYDRPGVADLVAESEPSVRSEIGFDGQFFFYLAHDPLLRGEVAWRALDAPKLRARRIGFAWLGRLAAPVRRYRDNGMAIAQGIGFLLLIGGLQWGACRAGRSAWAVLPAALSPALIVPLEYMTSEVTALGFLSLGLALYFCGSVIWAAAPFAMAILCKDMAAAAVVGLMVHETMARRWGRAAWLAAAGAPMAAWMLYLHLRLPVEGNIDDTLKNFGWPLWGFWNGFLWDLEQWRGGRAWWVQATELSMRCWFLLGVPLAAWRYARQWRSPLAPAAALAAVPTVMLSQHEANMAYGMALNFARQLFLLPAILWFEYLARPGEGSAGWRRAWWTWNIAGGVLGLLWAFLKLKGF